MGYFFTKKGYKCYHPPTRKFYASADVTFFENEPYFLTPYLQGETSLIEDEDRDLFLLELSSSSSIQLES